jgi:hypothetical protein
LPSRTAAIIPQPHEQKLQEVELADLGELELLRGGSDLRRADEAVECEPGGRDSAEAKQVPPADHGQMRLACARRVVRHHLPPFAEVDPNDEIA